MEIKETAETTVTTETPVPQAPLDLMDSQVTLGQLALQETPGPAGTTETPEPQGLLDRKETEVMMGVMEGMENLVLPATRDDLGPRVRLGLPDKDLLDHLLVDN